MWTHPAAAAFKCGKQGDQGVFQAVNCSTCCHLRVRGCKPSTTPSQSPTLACCWILAVLPADVVHSLLHLSGNKQAVVC
jgi:hypothetical protein